MAGARIHSNSWGSSFNGYSPGAMDIDAFMFENGTLSLARCLFPFHSEPPLSSCVPPVLSSLPACGMPCHNTFPLFLSPFVSPTVCHCLWCIRRHAGPGGRWQRRAERPERPSGHCRGTRHDEERAGRRRDKEHARVLR
eukprot:3935500-Rhodomonas_salina.2